jgi:Cu2+-exporting ATPase
LRVQAIHRNEILAEVIAARIRQIRGVQSVRANYVCSSIIVNYDQIQSDTSERVVTLLNTLKINPLQAKSRALIPGPPPPLDSRSGTGWLAALEPRGLPAVAIATAAVFGSLATGGFISTIAVALGIYCAEPSLRRAYNVIRDERRLNVDVLDTLAIAVAVLQGRAFTATFMVWLITLGDWIRDRTAAQSTKAIRDLLDFQQRRAWLCRGSKRVSVAVTTIEPRDVVVVYDGEMVPIDGQVIRGRALIDQRAITGESMPITKAVKDKVFAASVVHEGKIYVRAQRSAADSLAAEIVRMVESQPTGETRIQNYAEKFADRLVSPTLGFAGLMYLASRDVNRMLSVLIVAFGTGIRVAAPTTILASMSGAVRRGVLIRGGNRMERLSKLDSIVFDKTGTITTGVPRVVEVVSYNERHFPADQLLAVTALAELRCRHPVAFATVAAARRRHLLIPDRRNSTYHVGMGVEAQVNGYHVHAGSERFLRQNGIRIERAKLNGYETNGYSSLMVAVDGELVGRLLYEDELRPESAAVIKALHERGISNLIMLTGDNASTARHVAAAVGIGQLHAEIMPDEKAAIVQRLRDQGRVVAMVGDGINDAAALSYADVGIAMKNGTDVARESAHVVLVRDDLYSMVEAIDIARNAVRLVRQNYSIVVGMNVLALTMSVVGGLIRPELTALISNGSAVAASLNGLRPLLGA